MHTADFVPEKRSLYLFRGGNGVQYLNELHALNVGTSPSAGCALHHACDGACWPNADVAAQWVPATDTMTWTRPDSTGDPPIPRANHGSAVFRHELFLFGGWDGMKRLNDVHVFNTGTAAARVLACTTPQC